MSRLIKSPSISNPLSVPKGRIRKWSFSRSKDKKAQDNHFVRTNSGRWIKTEHPLIMTDDEDDEARRRREQQEASEQEEELRQQEASSFDGHQSGHGHNGRTSMDHDFQNDGPVIPPWHAAKPTMQWDPYSQANVAGPSSSSAIPNHSHSQSQPVDSYLPPASATDSPLSTQSPPSSSIARTKSNNIHNPPVPVAFPSMNYTAQPSPKVEPQDTDLEDSSEPRREQEPRRMKYKPGSLYPLHNPVKPDQPYTNWHLRPPDYDLPPIFMQPGYKAAGGPGAASGSSGGGAARPPDHLHTNQTSSGNGGSSGIESGTSPVKEGASSHREPKDRSHPPTLQPPPHPTLQQSTSAILGHSASNASLSRLANGDLITPSTPYPNLAANAHALLSPRSQSETALHLPPPIGDATLVRGHSPTQLHPKPEPGTLDVSDPLWGTTWSHASPYDLGRTPLHGIKIPAPIGGSTPNVPVIGSPTSGAIVQLPHHRRKAPSPSPLGGIRKRRPSADPAPGESSVRPSMDRDRSLSRPPSPGAEQREGQDTPPEPKQTNPQAPTHKSKVSGGGLRGLFHAAGSAVNLSEGGVMPRVRKRTISLGQTGIGIALGLGGNNANSSASGGTSQGRRPSFEIIRKLSFTGGGGHTRKQSFEVIRKPSVKPQQRPEIASAETTNEASGDTVPQDDVERGRSSQPKVIPDSEYATSPVDGARAFNDAALHPSADLSVSRTSEDLGRRPSASSRELARTPSGSRPTISHPLPLKRSPSASSTTPSMALVLNNKKSVSHLGHGEMSGVGLGRHPSQTSASQTSGSGAQQPQRVRKTSKPPAPPRTLNKYIHRFSANELPRSSHEPFMERRGGDGAPGMFKKVAKKLSWITKSAAEREREREVEEKMMMFEKERELERKLQEARDRGETSPQEDDGPTVRHDREAEVTGSDGDLPSTPDARDQQTDDEVADRLEPNGSASRTSHLSMLQPPSTMQYGISDSEQSGAEGSSRVVSPSPDGSSDFLDPRSPAKGRPRALKKSPDTNLYHPPTSPAMTTDSGLTPLAKLANVLMSPKTPATVATPSTQGANASLFSPMSLAATSLFSPKRTPSDSHLTLNPNIASPLMADSRNPSPTKQSTDGGHSLNPGHGWQPSRGSSPVPPRPITPPERRESPTSLPRTRMALTIMNPDSPSPPTPTRDLFPVQYSRGSEKRRRNAHSRVTSIDMTSLGSRKKEVVHAKEPEQSRWHTNGISDEAPQVPSKSPKLPVRGPKQQRDHDSSGSSVATSAVPGHVQTSADASSSSGYGAPYGHRPDIASVYSRPDSSTLTLTHPTPSEHQRPDTVHPGSSGNVSLPGNVSSPGIGYAVAPSTAPQSLESLMYYSPHHQAVLVPAQLPNGVSVMMLHPRHPQVIPAMQHMSSPGPPIHPMYASPYRNHPPQGSSPSFTAPTESITTTLVQAPFNYAAGQSRPTPQHSASDPQTPAQANGEVHRQLGRPRNPTRRETIAAPGRQCEVVGDENDRDSQAKRSDSKTSAKLRRRTPSRHYSGGSYETFGGTVIEEIWGTDSQDISRERDRQIRHERDSDREKARQYWEREREREQDRSTAKAQERQQSLDSTVDADRERMAEMERQVRESVWTGPPVVPDRERRDREGRPHRHSSKLNRSSTTSTIPPPPPPKNDVEQDVSAVRHSRSRRQQSDPPTTPVRSGKLSKSDRSRPPVPTANMNIGAIPKHHLEEKPLPRPMSDTRVDQDLSNIKANEAFARDRILKGTSLALDRSTMVEHVLGRSGPASSPENDPLSFSGSPQLRGFPKPPGLGSGYTSFSLQSPYMNGGPLHRPQVTYIPAPLGQYRDNPMPRPPRDASLDIQSR